MVPATEVSFHKSITVFLCSKMNGMHAKLLKTLLYSTFERRGSIITNKFRDHNLKSATRFIYINLNKKKWNTVYSMGSFPDSANSVEDTNVNCFDRFDLTLVSLLHVCCVLHSFKCAACLFCNNNKTIINSFCTVKNILNS